MTLKSNAKPDDVLKLMKYQVGVAMYEMAHFVIMAFKEIDSLELRGNHDEAIQARKRLFDYALNIGCEEGTEGEAYAALRCKYERQLSKVIDNKTEPDPMDEDRRGVYLHLSIPYHLVKMPSTLIKKELLSIPFGNDKGNVVDADGNPSKMLNYYRMPNDDGRNEGGNGQNV
jgi:hypothetical protein